MVVLERGDSLRLMRQLDHSLASGRMALEWVDMDGAALAPRLAFAIAWHDIVWAEEDLEPAWDEERRTPVTFQTLEGRQRRPLYANGLDRLEQIDAYAALLASVHFARFVDEPEGEEFRQNETKRRERIAAGFGLDASDPRLVTEAALLRHFDDLSLFACLCGPESGNPPEWLPLERVADSPDGRRHVPEWLGPDVLTFRPYPFRRPFHLAIPCRDLPRRRCTSAETLRQAWRDAPPRFHEVRIIAA
jgi:hypothetical protein